MLGVTEATGICGMEVAEKEYDDAQEVMGEDEEVTGEFFSRLGEFSQALRADSIWRIERRNGCLMVCVKKFKQQHFYVMHNGPPLMLNQQWPWKLC